MKRLTFTFDEKYSPDMMRKFLLAINQRFDDAIASTAKSSGESATSNLARRTIDVIEHNFPLGRGTHFELYGVGHDAGITGMAGGADGRLIIVRNVGVDAIRFFHNSNSSVVGNRIRTRDENTMSVTITNGAVFVYDGPGQVWIPIGMLP